MSWRAKVQTNTIGMVLTITLILFAVGFAGFAIYLSLLPHFHYPLAALFTALIFLALAGFTVLFTKWLSEVRAKKIRETKRLSNESTDEIEAAIQQFIDPTIHRWIRQHPTKSLIATVVAGVVIGSNRDLQQSAKAALQRFLGDKDEE